MKTHLCLILICLFPLAILNPGSVMASDPTIQILSNGGFESGDFTGWSLGGPSGIWSITPSDKHTGNYSARILFAGAANERAATLTSDFYQVTGSHYATLAFWVKAPQLVNNAKLHILAEWYNSAYEPLGDSWQTIQSTPIPNWVRYEIPMVFPAEVSFVHIYLGAQAFSGDIVEAYVDDLSLSVAYNSVMFLPLVARP